MASGRLTADRGEPRALGEVPLQRDVCEVGRDRVHILSGGRGQRERERERALNNLVQTGYQTVRAVFLEPFCPERCPVWKERGRALSLAPCSSAGAGAGLRRKSDATERVDVRGASCQRNQVKVCQTQNSLHGATTSGGGRARRAAGVRSGSDLIRPVQVSRRWDE